MRMERIGDWINRNYCWVFPLLIILMVLAALLLD